MGLLSETAASLRIIGEDLDPDEVTNLLGRNPDIALRRGQIIHRPSGSRQIARRGHWSVKAERRSPGDLDTQIAVLLAGTTEDLSVWQKLTSVFDADVFCGLFMEERNEGLCIAPATLKKLGDRGLELALDIYVPEREDHD